ncbi:MAG: hypothetical protein ACOZAR_03885 [Patescibacteria group bacterium]
MQDWWRRNKKIGIFVLIAVLCLSGVLLVWWARVKKDSHKNISDSSERTKESEMTTVAQLEIVPEIRSQEVAFKLLEENWLGMTEGQEMSGEQALQALMLATTSTDDLNKMLWSEVIKSEAGQLAASQMSDSDNVKKMSKVLPGEWWNVVVPQQKRIIGLLTSRLRDDSDLRRELAGILVGEEKYSFFWDGQKKKNFLAGVVKGDVNLADYFDGVQLEEIKKQIATDFRDNYKVGNVLAQRFLVLPELKNKNQSSLVAVKLKHGEEILEVPMDKIRWRTGSLVMVLEPLPEFAPGQYNLEVEFFNSITNKRQLFTQDFSWGVLSVNTDQDWYLVGEKMKIDIGILDDQGSPICDAEASLVVKDAQGNVVDSLPVTNTGECKVLQPGHIVPDYNTEYTAAKAGEYFLNLKVKTRNGERTATSSIRVLGESSEFFRVKRTSATRNFPFGMTPMNLEVEFGRDFSGRLVEVVPADFGLEQIGNDGVEVTENGQKKIVWKVEANTGDRLMLDYWFDAPNISPMFYVLGPVTLEDEDGRIFSTEKRVWQIANDITCAWTNGNANNSWSDAGNWSGCGGNVPGVGAGVDYDVLFQPVGGGGSGSELIKVNTDVPGTCDSSGTHDTPCPDGDGRLGMGTSGTGDVGAVAHPSIIYDGGVYKMWYTGRDGSGVTRIFYAYSNDGSTWTKYDNTVETPSNTTGTNGRIPLGVSGSGDDTGVWIPHVINDGGTYKMWYAGSSASSDWRIYMATSTDGGLTWTKVDNSLPADSDTTSTNGRVPLGTAGKGDRQTVHGASVMNDGGTYKMWYMAQDTSYVFRIYYATSPDGLTWTKYDNTIPADSNTSSTNGRVPPGLAGSGDDTHVAAPNVYFDGGTYKMWYLGGNGDPFFYGYRIYYATSSDGLVWTKFDNSVPADSDTSSTNWRVAHGTDGKGDDYSIDNMCVVVDGTDIRMYYGGNDGSYTRIYSANNISTGGSPDVSLDTNVNIGSLEMSGGYGGTVYLNSRTVNIGGTFNHAEGNLDAGTSTIIFDGTTSGSLIVSGGSELYNLEFNGGGGDWTLYDPLTVNGTLTTVNGELIKNSQNIIAKGTVSLANNTFTAGSGGEFRLNGDFNLNSGNNNLGHLIVGASPDTITLTSDLMATDLSIADWDSLITDGFDISVDDFVTIYGEATLDATAGTGGDTNISVGGNWTNYSIFTADTSTVTFTATDTGNTINSGWWGEFNNVVFDGVGGEWILQDDMVINGDLTITNGTLDINGHNLTVSGTFTNNGRLKLNGYEGVSLTNDTDSGTIEYYGVGVDNNLVTGNDYYNLLISGASDRWATGEVHINNDLIITAGSLNIAWNNLTITGNLDNTSGSSGIYNVSRVLFNAPDKNNTIRLSGAQLYDVVFSEERGEWILLDDMYVNRAFDIKSGLFNVGNNVLTVRQGFYIRQAGRFQKGESSIVRFSPDDDREWGDETYEGQDLGVVEVTGGTGVKNLIVRWNVAKCTSLFVDTGHTVKLLQTELRLTGEGTPISGLGTVDTWSYGESTVSYNGGQNTNVLTSGAVNRYDSLNIDSSTGLLMKIGEDDLRSSVIDTDNGYAYFGTAISSPAMIIKVRLSDLTRVATLMMDDAGELGAAAIDLANHKAYFVYSSPGIQIIKIDLDTFTIESKLALTNVGTPSRSAEFTRTATIDNDGGYLYIGSTQSSDGYPAMLVKVRLSDFTVEDDYTFNSGYNGVTCGVIDPANDFGYFAMRTNPGTIVKIKLSDMSHEEDLTLSAGENAPMAAIIDTSGGYAYFGTTSNNEGGSGNRIVKIRLSDFSEIESLVTSESEYDTAVFDPINNMGYFGTSTYVNYVVQVDLANMTKLNSAFITNDAGITTSIIDSTGGFAYFGTSASAGQIYKINLYTSLPGVSTSLLKENNVIPGTCDSSGAHDTPCPDGDGRLGLGTSGMGDEKAVDMPAVIYDGGVYKMWYTGKDDAGGVRIFYAYSTDGLTWTKYDNSIEAPSNTTGTNGRIPWGEAGSGDATGVWIANVINDSGTYKMWYAGSSADSDWRIYMATSTDGGLTWTKVDNSLPVDSDTTSTNGRIPLGTADKGDEQTVHGASVINDGGTYKMWYMAQDTSFHFRIYYATSPDGLTWTKYDNDIPDDSDTDSTNGRVPLGLTGGDMRYVAAPHVYKDGSNYRMWYLGGSDFDYVYRMYYVTSPDGLVWTKLDNSVPANTDTSSTNWRVAYGTDGRGDYFGVGNMSAVIVGNSLKMYYGGSGAGGSRIYLATADVNTPMSIDSHLTLMPGEDSFGAEVIDTVNGYAYYGTRTKPGVIVKVRLSDFSRVDSITLDDGEWNLETAVIDQTAGYAYFATNTNIGKIIKIRLSDFTKVATLTLNPGEDSFESSVIDTVDGYAYFGTAGYSDWIVKIRLSDFSRVGAISTDEDENTSATIDTTRGYAYFTNTADQGKIRKLRLSDFTIEDTLELDDGENRPIKSGIDLSNNVLYIGTSYNDRKIIKVDLSTFTEVGTMDSDSDIISGVAIDTIDGYGYFVLTEVPGRMLKVRLSDFSKVGTTTMNNGANWTDSILMGDDFIYMSASTSPSIVIRVPKNGLNTFSTGAGESLIIDKNLTIEGYNVDWDTNDTAITLKGNFYIDSLARWQKSPTQTFTWSPEGTKTFTDLTYDLQDIGFVDETGGHSEIVLLTPIHLTTLHIANGHTFNLNGYDFSIDSTYTSEGKLKLFGSETVTGFVNDLDSGNVEYYGTGTYSSLHTGNDYYDLIFNGGGGSFSLDNDLDAEHDLTVTAGTLLSDGFEMDMSGTVSIATAGVLNASDGTDGVSLIRVQNNWSNAGSFVAGGSTVELTGENQLITGATTFYNLLKTEMVDNATDEVLTFGSGQFQKISNLLTFDGRDGDDMIWLRSSVPGGQAFIEFDGTGVAIGTVKWLDIQDHAVINSNGAAVVFPVNPANSINSGNNSNWFELSTALAESATVTATVPSLLSFAINPVASGQNINGELTNINTTTAGVDFGIFAGAADKIGAHDLVVSTNGGGGYVVTLQYDHQLMSSAANVPNFPGSNSSPIFWSTPPGSGTEGYFGYTTNDISLGGMPIDRFVADKWSGFSPIPEEVVYYNGAVADQLTRVGYRLQITNQQAAGFYANTLRYICTSTY